MGRDKYGHYVNDKGVTIKVNTDKNGKDHISFYDKSVDKPHSGVHVDVDYKKSSWSSNTHNEDRSEKDKSSGSCYLTTACMEHYLDSFDDNCYELSTLRNFRDKYVSKEDVAYYYEVAPRIVEAIGSAKNRVDIFNNLYDTIVLPCVKFIENKKYNLAYAKYKESILELEKKYLKNC